MRAAGADVDATTGPVRLDRGLVERALATAPASFDADAAQSSTALTFGGAAPSTSGWSPARPTCTTCERGRRAGQLPGLLRLHPPRAVLQRDPPDRQPGVRAGRAAGELPPPRRLSREHRLLRPRLSLLGHRRGPRARRHPHDGDRPRHDARGDAPRRRACITIISVNSPRRFDEAMADGLIAMAMHGQPVVITPFTLMGAMAPVSPRGRARAAERRGPVRRRARAGWCDPARR